MQRAGNNRRLKSWDRSVKKYWQLYLLLVPVAAYYLLFKYYPMLGAQIAFKNYKFSKGIWGSSWVGLKHFQRFFSSYNAGEILVNTLWLCVLTLLFCFPMPIMLSLIINELRGKRAKKLIQTVTYAPHFISTVVVIGMMTAMLSPSTGIINQLLIRVGIISDGLYFMASPKYFRLMYVISAIWKDCGWNAIIFISALAAIDGSLYEAARVDGASRWQQLLHITIPGILPTIVIMLILESGKVMNIGFEKVFAMQTDLNLSVSEVISTYTYKMGLVDMKYDYATAIGLFNSVINFALLLTVNYISKRLTETSLW
ncbi:MAG: sugar ABC transporter permease [Clostridia bacterium]|nr:sugar ABC transporter permease [Clostridia bacterium]